MHTKKLSMLLAVGLTLAIATPAAAAVNIVAASSTTLAVSGPGTTIYFNGQSDGTPVSGVSSSLFLQLTGQTATTATFHFTVTNSSTASTSPNLSGFGFDSAPDITSATTTSLVFPNMSSGSISNSKSVEFCFTAGSNCAGGADGGVAAGGNTTGDFTLSYTSLPATFTLNNFIVRYQNLPQPYGSGIGVPVGSVPEPATWAMMLLGFGGMGIAMRRGKRRIGALTQIA